ncbi:MAG TPA: PDZ domain-containing protein, partial [Gammaproteobacteria bacterium]
MWNEVNIMKILKTLLIVMGMATAPLTQAASSASPASTPAPAASTAPDQEQLERQLEDARKQLQEAAHKVAELSMQLNGSAMRNLDLMQGRMEKLSKRGFLGIDVDSGEDGSGVQVSGVTPGGPAEKAGLREGDVITGINGTAFKPSGDDSAGDKLVEFMRNTKPGDSLKIAYTRDGKAATATAKAGSVHDIGDGFFFGMGPMPPLPPAAPRAPEPPMAPMAPMEPWRGFNMYFSNGGRWGDVQLVTLTPGLGQYFGTDKGLLVLRVPKDSALQLQEGDVIMQVGGRDPGSPPHAMRILSSYGPGESIKIDIMRKGKPQTLNVTLPKTRGDDDSSNTWIWTQPDDDTTPS